MEECTALTVYKPTFTPEDLEQIGNAAQQLGEALTRIRESFTKIAEALADARSSRSLKRPPSGSETSTKNCSAAWPRRKSGG